MLTTKILGNDINVNSFISSQDYSSDRDHYNNKLLNLGTLSVINSINDSEVYEYKPDAISELNFNIFFLKYMQENMINEITPYIESDFTNQVTKTKIAFGLIDTNNNTLQHAFNSVYEIRQPGTNLREPTLTGEINQTKLSALNAKPYVVSDIIGASTIKNPQQTGLPIFYNSYTLPFWDKKDTWIKDPLLYKNKPYFNNSFMLVEFYDSPSALNQSRVISIPVFVNSRYNIKERTNNNVTHERPCFKLKDGFDGFSFFFLNNYIKSDFYAKFSFWDSANGKKISLLPSSNDEKDKKWFQNVNTFKQENNYLKYVLDYVTKTYKIYEYNSVTNDYDLQRTNFDLYELAFDSYYEDLPVSNNIPYDAGTVKPIPRPNSPLKFQIRNLYNDVYLGNSVSEKKIIPYDKTKTYLYDSQRAKDNSYHTGIFLDKISDYRNTLPNNRINTLPKSNFTYPQISNFKDPIVINGFVRNIRTFIGSSVDTEVWRIRKLSLDDVFVTIDDNLVFDKTYYLETQASWDVQNKSKVSESMTLLINDQNDIKVNGSLNDFIIKIMSSVDFIPHLIDKMNQLINNAAAKANADNYDEFNRLSNVTRLINPILQLTDVRFTHYQNFLTWDYRAKSYINQLVPNIDTIKSRYSALVNNNDPRCLSLRKNILDQFKNITNYDILSDFIKLIYDKFNVSEYNELVNEYTKYVASYDNSTIDLNELKRISDGGYNYIISTIDDKPQLRNYLFNVVVTQSGDQYITKNENLLFNMSFIIGENTKSLVYGAEKITVSGKLRVSVIDNKANIKNIVIPIRTTLLAGQKQIIPATTIIPQIDTNLTNANTIN